MAVIWFYREGFDLYQRIHAIFFSVWNDSIHRYAKDWHLFDNGRLPMGHFDAFTTCG